MAYAGCQWADRRPAGAVVPRPPGPRKCRSRPRALVYRLRPIELDDLGLAGALRQKVAAMNDARGPQPEVRLQLPDELPVRRGPGRCVPDRVGGAGQRRPPLNRPTPRRPDHGGRGPGRHRRGRQGAAGRGLVPGSVCARSPTGPRSWAAPQPPARPNRAGGWKPVCRYDLRPDRRVAPVAALPK